MNPKNYSDLLFEYLKNDLLPEEKEKLERLLMERGYDQDELREMRELYLGIDELPVPSPGEGMSDRFYAMLEDEKGRQSPARSSSPGWLARLTQGGRWNLWPRLAYSALLLLIGWMLGSYVTPDRKNERKMQYMASEMVEMKKMMMFSMLNRSSAVERLQAVQYLKDIAPQDEQALTALLDLFDNDPNVNVRLSTLDALAGMAENERIREGLLNGIGRQKSPLIQLALVEAMVSLGEKRAAGYFQDLLERKELNVMVRSRIAEGLRLLS